MRGVLKVLLAATLMLLAGCAGSKTIHVSPSPTFTPDASSSEPIPENQPPVAEAHLFNQTHAETLRHFVDENITANASTSHDPDGILTSYSWRIYENGQQVGAPLIGPVVHFNFSTPGDRAIVLRVADDQDLATSLPIYFGVHQHLIKEGRVVLAPAVPPITAPDAAGGLIEANYSMLVQSGAWALSINATFPESAATKVRLEIRAPNGTVVNQSEGAASPLWAITLPQTPGNYTAHLFLISGTSVTYRLEFVAWYGFNA